MQASDAPHDEATVYGIGSAAIDFRIRTADLGKDYTEKLLAQETDVLGGGAASNCMVQVARLGGKAVWLGKLGADWIGDRIIEGLADEGVDVSRVHRDPSVCSPFNVAVYAGEARRRVGGFLLPNSLQAITADDWQAWLDHFKPGDWLFAEIGEVPFFVIHDFCIASRQHGVKVAIDVDLDPITQCGVTHEDVKQLFTAVDLLVPNVNSLKTFCPGMTPEEITTNLAESSNATVVTTAGSDGACYCMPGQPLQHQAAVPTEVVDTVGAGDAFHGGLMFALARGETLPAAVALAARCGALACRRAGARTGMPRYEEVS